MDFFKQHKTLYSIVSAVLAVSLVVYCFGFYSVQAAEISTLPADIDCTMDYDSDYVRFTVDGRTTVINRHMHVYDCDNIPYRFDSYDDFKASADSMGLDNFSAYLPSVNGGSVGFAVKNSNGAWTYTLATLPFSIEENREGSLSPTSYWYSPSQDKIYIFTGGVYNSYSRAVKSYSLGNFLFDTSNSSCKLYVTCIDCRTDSVVNKLDKLSGCDYYSYSYNWTARSGYPDDLLCFFANHEISGFYEPDTSKVNTPDYYFNYQYIFYLDGKGYTFIDSAQPLTEVTAQSSYAYLTFSDACNKYIYTSVDGITWELKTTVDDMYGVNYLRLAYDWFYSNVTVGAVNQYDAALVYANDDKFGDKPLVTPEWADLQDVIKDLPDISHGFGDSGNGQDSKYLPALDDRSSFYKFLAHTEVAIANLISGDLGYGLSYLIDKQSADKGYEAIFTDISDVYMSSLIREFQSFVTYDYAGDFNGESLYIPRTTLYGFVSDISYKLSNVQWYLENGFSGLSVNLKSLFDNVTITNTHLSDISDKLSKLSIPDYDSVLSDISAKLDKLPASGSFATPFDDAAILDRFDIANDYLKDIKGLETSNLLTNILNLLTGTDGEGLKVTINPNFKLNIDNDLKAEFTAKIDKIFDKLFDIDATLDKIAEFNIGTGGTDKDYSSILTLINENLYTVSGRIYDLNQPLDSILQAINNIDLSVSFPESEPKNDLFYDDPDSDEDLIDFVAEYAKTALDKSYFASYLSFDNDTMSGIRFYNGLSEEAFKALGPFSSVLLVPVGFTLVGAAVRRHT